MKLEKVLVVAIVVVLVAAAGVFLSKRPAGEPDGAGTEAGPARVSLLVVGIPGLDPDLVEELSARGSLPNLAGLMKRGAVGTFEHLGKGVDLRITWTSLATGKTPERQGIGGTMIGSRGHEVSAPLLSTSRTAETIWTILSDEGRTAVVAGWPGTWPVEPVNGVMAGPYEQYTLERSHTGSVPGGVYPPSRGEVFDALYGDPGEVRRRDLARFIDLETDLGYEALIGMNYEALAAAMTRDLSMAAIVKEAVRDPGVESALVYFDGLNDVEQRFWHYRHPEQFSMAALNPEYQEIYLKQVDTLGSTIDRYYEFIDEILGDLLAAVRDDAVVAVISDHGYEGLKSGPRGSPIAGPAMYSDRGMWILSGPKVRPGVRDDGGGLLDVAPTILEAASLPIPADLDGTTLTDLFASDM